jgi:6-phosphogluconate dehydrogenase (decarboxylating)
MVYRTPGRPMARNLMEAGYELVLYNRTRSKAEDLAREGGAEVAGSPEEVARRSGVIFTMLPGPPEVGEVVAGEGGLLQGASEGSLIVDTSTSSPVLARELARIARERGSGCSTPRSAGATWGPKRGRSRSWSGEARRTSRGLNLCLRSWAGPSSTSAPPEPGRSSRRPTRSWWPSPSRRWAKRWFWAPKPE